MKCTCTKTGCLKKYCYCFAKGIPCEDCECKNCQNRGKENNNNKFDSSEKEMQKILYLLLLTITISKIDKDSPKSKYKL